MFKVGLGGNFNTQTGVKFLSLIKSQENQENMNPEQQHPETGGSCLVGKTRFCIDPDPVGVSSGGLLQ